jgi:hypothetical protein
VDCVLWRLPVRLSIDVQYGRLCYQLQRLRFTNNPRQMATARGRIAPALFYPHSARALFRMAFSQKQHVRKTAIAIQTNNISKESVLETLPEQHKSLHSLHRSSPQFYKVQPRLLRLSVATAEATSVGLTGLRLHQLPTLLAASFLPCRLFSRTLWPAAKLFLLMFLEPLIHPQRAPHPVLVVLLRRQEVQQRAKQEWCLHLIWGSQH